MAEVGYKTMLAECSMKQRRKRELDIPNSEVGLSRAISGQAPAGIDVSG